MLDLASVELTFVLDLIQLFRSASRIDYAYLFAFGEKHAFHSHIGLDCYYVVIYKKAFPHSSLILVTINYVFEVSLCVSGRRGGQPDFDRVKMIEGFAPH